MDFRHPLRVVTPTLDGDVLALLAGGEIALTGREIGRRISASQEGVRRALDRLVGQGIVLRQIAGRSHLFQLNRKHLAAPCVEQLAAVRRLLVERLQRETEGWSITAAAVVLFGSVARGEASSTSDIDLLVVRNDDTDADDPAWRRQLSALRAEAAAATGNDARIAEYSAADVRRDWYAEPLFPSALDEGLDLAGSLAKLRPRQARGKRR